MISDVTKSSIKYFLNICQKEIPKGNCYFIENRMIDMNGKVISAKQALLDIGILNKKQILNIILTLEEKDCIKVDFDKDHSRDTNSEIYIFKKEYNKNIIYIKLTMRKKGIICLSFHRSY